jgi:uncharacterized protein (DUF983 family)
MFAWIWVLLGRVASGEELERSSPSDYRAWAAVFFIFPIILIAGVRYAELLISHASTWLVFLIFVLGAVVSFLLWALWYRLVPALVSLILGLATWGSLIWLAWHGKLGI